MAKAAPAFQIYPADYMASTSTFTDAESGVYSKLLFWSWTNGPLPFDQQRIRRAAQSSATDAEWTAIWATVETKWTRTAEGYINNRLERTRKEQEDYRERQKGNGAKGGRPKTHTEPKNNPVVSSGETQQVTQTEPTENLSVLRSSPLTSDLRSSPLPECVEPPAPEIAAILSKPAFDRTNDENDALAEHRGVTIRPVGARLVRQSQESIAYREVTCRKHYGQGALPSCHKGVCVPSFLGQSWESQCSGEADPGAYVRQFIADVCRGLSGPVGDDPLPFWRGQWKAKHGSALLDAPRSNAGRTIAAAQKAVELIEAREARERQA